MDILPVDDDLVPEEPPELVDRMLQANREASSLDALREQAQ